MYRCIFWYRLLVRLLENYRDLGYFRIFDSYNLENSVLLLCGNCEHLVQSLFTLNIFTKFPSVSQKRVENYLQLCSHNTFGEYFFARFFFSLVFLDISGKPCRIPFCFLPECLPSCRTRASAHRQWGMHHRPFHKYT